MEPGEYEYVPEPAPIFLCELELRPGLLADLNAIGVFTGGDYKQAGDDDLLDEVITRQDQQHIDKQLAIAANARQP